METLSPCAWRNCNFRELGTLMPFLVSHLICGCLSDTFGSLPALSFHPLTNPANLFPEEIALVVQAFLTCGSKKGLERKISSFQNFLAQVAYF